MASASGSANSLLVELHATAGLRATKAHMARAPAPTAPTSPPPTPLAPPSQAPSSPGSPALASPLAADSEEFDVSGDEFQARLMDLHFDAVVGANRGFGDEDDQESDDLDVLPRPASPTESVSGLFGEDSDDDATGSGQCNGSGHPIT